MPSDTPVDDSLRLRFFRYRRPASVDEVAGELWSLLSALGALSPRLAQWSTRDAGFRVQRVRNARECARYLATSEVELPPGNRPTHRMVLTCPGERASSCDLRILFALQGGPGRWSFGHRLEMRLGVKVGGAAEAPGTLIREIALAVIRAFRPHAGFVGTMVDPDLRWDETREPEASWMTYLSSDANAEAFRGRGLEPDQAPPPSTKAPSTVLPVDDLGWLITAFPEIMRPGEAPQRLVIDQVRSALGPRVRQESLQEAPEMPRVEAPRLPPRAGEVPSSIASSPWAAPAKNKLAGTSLSVEPPRGPALPFVASPEPPRIAAHSDELASRRPSKDLGGTALAVNVPRGPSLPFEAPVPASAEGEGPRAIAKEKARSLGARVMELPSHVRRPEASASLSLLTLERYASLFVDLTEAPERAPETLGRYRLTSDQYALMVSAFQERFSTEPGLRAAWEQACSVYREWLRATKR